ncbi:lycopene cyclase domain-containing protein [Corynebacterium pacaense]|uniref:lycopene cyclase domain-containing protein n=1 Tax=Corynebacterium pacaense TaxID=1816684 RepID=UPI0009B94165|nr:lycopene cyclase domain-containing protein [Corynebacterium pacaense]
MSAFLYLTLLLVFTACMVLCDWRWRLAFFRSARRSAAVIAVTLTVFLAWDALGIATGTFHKGGSPYMTGLDLAPHMPVEEPVFLFFLCYLTLNLTSAVGLRLGAPVPDRRCDA